MDLKEKFINSIKSISVDMNTEEGISFVDLNTESIFEEHILNKNGITLEQFINVQKDINKLQIYVAEYVKDTVEKTEAFEVFVNYEIFHDSPHKLDIEQNYVFSSNENVRVSSVAIMSDSGYGINEAIFFLFNSINN